MNAHLGVILIEACALANFHAAEKRQRELSKATLCSTERVIFLRVLPLGACGQRRVLVTIKSPDEQTASNTPRSESLLK